MFLHNIHIFTHKLQVSSPAFESFNSVSVLCLFVGNIISEFNFILYDDTYVICV